MIPNFFTHELVYGKNHLYGFKTSDNLGFYDLVNCILYSNTSEIFQKGVITPNNNSIYRLNKNMPKYFPVFTHELTTQGTKWYKPNEIEYMNGDYTEIESIERLERYYKVTGTMHLYGFNIDNSFKHGGFYDINNDIWYPEDCSEYERGLITINKDLLDDHPKKKSLITNMYIK